MYEKTASKIDFMATPSIQEATELTQNIPASLGAILDASANIADQADNLGIDLNKMGHEVMELVNDDKTSMEPWVRRYKKAIHLAKMKPEHEVKNFPFEKASNLMTPYILQAAIDFNARSTPIFIERKDICKAMITGKEREIQFVTNPQTGEEKELSEQEAQQYQQMVQQQAQQMQAMPPQQGQPPPQQMPPIETKQGSEKQDQADRVVKAVNYDLTTGIANWRELKDKELFILPIVGSTFRLTKQDAFENKRVSSLINPDLLICDHNKDSFEEVRTKSFEYTMTKNDVITAIASGQFIEIDMDVYSEEKVVEFTESHCWLDLDDDGYEEPYIVTFQMFSSEIVSIVPRFDEDDVWVDESGDVARIKAEEFFTHTIFMPDPNGGFMGVGYGILLGPMFEAITTLYNQIIDAGTLGVIGSNSGFIRGGDTLGPRAGNRQRKGEIKMQMGVFTTLESSGTNPLANDVVNFPFKGADPTLFQMLGFMVDNVKAMTQAGAIEVQANEAADMYLARLRESMISTNSIRIRVATGMTKEIKRIVELQAKYLGQDEYMDILDDPDADWEKDYELKRMDISFTADPTQGSDQERISRAGVILQNALQAGPSHDLRYAYKVYYSALGIHDSDEMERILPEPKQGEPDPIAIMQAEAMKTMSEAEMLSAQVKVKEAQIKEQQVALQELQLQIEFAKLQPEIEKLNAETLKNLSEVDKNEMTATLQRQKQLQDHILKQADTLQRGIDNGRNQARADRQETDAIRRV